MEHLTAHKDTLRRVLRRWFAANRRSFLWRTEPRSPYVVLVAEVMLQQTQVWRVQAKLPQFLEHFPTLQALATASTAQVLRQWQGMGYNRRALQLHTCARQVCERFGGCLPNSYEQLRQLPGIGDYTARALLAFAFGKDVPVVDVNVQRVLSRVGATQKTWSDVLPLHEVLECAQLLLPRGGARWWNEALMDLGSTVCTRRQPRCTECPFYRWCMSSSSLLPPPKKARKAEPSYQGIPRRLWRGRIIELLRNHEQLSLDALANTLWENPSSADHEWLENLVQQLEREGLVTRDRMGMLTLPP